MRFLKETPARWAVPVALSAALITGLLISPVIAGQGGVSGKKVNKTIAKKTNVTQLSVPSAINIGTGSTTLGTLTLSPGNYDVTTTFDARQNAAAVNVACQLRIVGVAQDSSNSFTGTGTISAENSVAMEVVGRAGTTTRAELTCTASGPALANHVDITALKVPQATVLH